MTLPIEALNEDQYHAYNVLTAAISGPLRSEGARCFVTGPGGKGEKYLLVALESWTRSLSISFLEMARTGTAAINIGAQTTHSTLAVSGT